MTIQELIGDLIGLAIICLVTGAYVHFKEKRLYKKFLEADKKIRER